YPESDDESNYQPFTKTIVLLLYRDKKGKWTITHTMHEQQPGVKVTPIFKAESTNEELTSIWPRKSRENSTPLESDSCFLYFRS
ncbi:MAG: hypothetical protein P8X55_15050, partial [Desulfosarcinaceae bacterium]